MRFLAGASALLLLANLARGQNQWTANALGQSFLQANGSNPAIPVGATVGNAAVGSALFQIRADQFAAPNPNQAIQNNTFETRGDVDEQQFWRMYRGSSDASHQWGRLYVTDANTNLGFNLQQVQQGGSLWLRNVRNRPNGTATGQTDKIFTGNGLRLIDDAPFNLNGYLTNGRCGYVAIGHTFSMDQTGMSAIPWTRLHLTHQNNVDNTASGNTAVWQRRLGYRPWMRNGMMITGNKDQMYVGHKYRYTGSTPQGNETLDASDAVIQWADTTGSPQTTDNFRRSLPLHRMAPQRVGRKVSRVWNCCGLVHSTMRTMSTRVTWVSVIGSRMVRFLLNDSTY